MTAHSPTRRASIAVRFLAATSTLAACFAIHFIAVPSANADENCFVAGSNLCGFIKHYSPDSGNSRAIKFRCNFGVESSSRYLDEGEKNTDFCVDADQVYVASGQEIWCNLGGGTGGPFYKKWDATGWYKIYDGQSFICVSHVD